MKTKILMSAILSFLMIGCTATPSPSKTIPEYIESEKTAFNYPNKDIETVQIFEFVVDSEDSTKVEKTAKNNQIVQALSKEKFNEEFKKTKFNEIQFQSRSIVELGQESSVISQLHRNYVKSVSEKTDKENGFITTEIETDKQITGKEINYKITRDGEGKILKINFYVSELMSIEKVMLDDINFIEVPKTKEYSFDSKIKYKNELYLVLRAVEKIEGNLLFPDRFEEKIFLILVH